MGTYVNLFNDFITDRRMRKREYPTMSTTYTAGVARPTYYCEAAYRRTTHYHAARTGKRWK